jgi:hypothetical protein
MMMMSPKKKIATIIMASLGKKPEGPKVEPVSNEVPEEDNSMAEESSAEAVLKAVESKDAKALAAAMKDFLEICSYKPEESEAE